jgi:hypothetical protein
MSSTFNLGNLADGLSGSNRLALIDCRDWQEPQGYTYAGLDELADAGARGLARRRRFKANWQTRLLGAAWRLDDVRDIIGVETVNVLKGRLNGPNQIGVPNATFQRRKPILSRTRSG